MRQSDGSEILGPDDPRNLVIGIIHVSPDDDRQSVINAITTQDQEGRDQVVLVLPARNKALKNSVDFEGLHHMAGELEAALVLVVPSKSKIENLARKENFTCYSTLEELAAAEFPPLVPEGELSQPAPPMQSARQVQPIPPTLPVQAEEEQGMDQAMMFPLDIPDMPAPAAPSSTDAPADVSPSAPQPSYSRHPHLLPRLDRLMKRKASKDRLRSQKRAYPSRYHPRFHLHQRRKTRLPLIPPWRSPRRAYQPIAHNRRPRSRRKPCPSRYHPLSRSHRKKRMRPPPIPPWLCHQEPRNRPAKRTRCRPLRQIHP